MISNCPDGVIIITVVTNNTVFVPQSSKGINRRWLLRNFYLYYTKEVVRKCTSVDIKKWDFSIQILTKHTSIGIQKRFVYYDIEIYIYKYIDNMYINR